MREILVHHRGSLRFFGDWFGRPMDNYHKVVNANYYDNSDILVITFDGGEECIVKSPIDIVSTKNSFYVKGANCVTWSWYCYGKEHIKENRLQIHYKKEDENIVTREKCGFNYTQPKTQIEPNGFYAVEIC